MLSLRSGVPFTDLVGGEWTGPDVMTLEHLVNVLGERKREGVTGGYVG